MRAKSKIRIAGIPYSVPAAEDLAERLDAVLAVLYLIFNEGYFPSTGNAVVRSELCDEALRLCRLLVQLLPEPEAFGLLALLLLTDARRPARQIDGAFVSLEDQERTRWDAAKIADGMAVLARAVGARRPGPFQIQAAIAAEHARARTFAETHWRAIAALYGQLAAHEPSPVVELNRAVAIGMSEGPEPALLLLGQPALVAALADYQPFYAARAELCRRAGRLSEAAQALDRAIALTANGATRAFLQAKLAPLQQPP